MLLRATMTGLFSQSWLVALFVRWLRPFKQSRDLIVQWAIVRGPVPLPLTDNHKDMAIVPASVDAVGDNASLDVWVPSWIGIGKYLGKWIGHCLSDYLLKIKFICFYVVAIHACNDYIAKNTVTHLNYNISQ